MKEVKMTQQEQELLTFRQGALETSYGVLVQINCWAGNYERAMCAFMTGVTDEKYDVGKEYVERAVLNRFRDKVDRIINEVGTISSVEIYDQNSFVIYFKEKLYKEDMAFLKSRAKKFEKMGLGKDLFGCDGDKFKFVGIHQFQITRVSHYVEID